jgi:CBS domain-containing protein/mannitol/fructose-specific phosphotransferase system IIA component (Ntr-type)
MQLREILGPENILVPLEAASLHEAIIALIQRLAQHGIVRTSVDVERLVASAGGRDLVTIGDQVALPHQRTDAVDRLVVALGIAREPLAAPEAGDRVRPRIVFLILAPREGASSYLQALAAIGRLLRDDRIVDRLLAARSAEDVLAIRDLGDLRIEPQLAVRDVMAHDVPVVAPDAPAREALETMIRERVNAVVVTGEKQEVLGIVSEVDLMRALLPQVPPAGDREAGPGLGALKVRDVMTRSVLCISPELGLDEAASTMINKNVEQLPVVSEGRLTGILTRAEIIRKLFAR